MRFAFASVRTAFAVVTLIAVIVTFAATAAAGPVNLFNFFGYFTIQSNLLIMLALAMAAIDGVTGRRQSPLLYLFRGATASYIIVVGVVYNTLLVGLDGGAPVAWTNHWMHIVMPIYGLLDWLFFADRPPLPWKAFWLVLIYPIIWSVVTLIRGGIVHWFPYPFLNYEKIGGGAVALYCVGIAIGFLAFGAAVWGLSRVHILKPADGVPVWSTRR